MVSDSTHFVNHLTKRQIGIQSATQHTRKPPDNDWNTISDSKHFLNHLPEVERSGYSRTSGSPILRVSGVVEIFEMRQNVNKIIISAIVEQLEAILQVVGYGLFQQFSDR